MTVAVVPVKVLSKAKSRLRLPADQRAGLALAFAMDTVAALLATPGVAEVVVVCDEPTAVAPLTDLGAHVVTDDSSHLNDAIRTGSRAAADHGADRLVIAPADLPCLRPEDVHEVLTALAPATPAFVADRAGTGTTLLVAPARPLPTTAYGPDSAARHTELGLTRIGDPPLPACQDVDTWHDLRAAVELGVGRHTAAQLAALSLTGAQA